MWAGEVVARKSREDVGQPIRVFQVGEVGGAGQRLEAAVGDRLLGLAAVRERDGAVALAPDDQRRHLLQQVEAVSGADLLALDVDHRAQRLQEGAARAGLLQRTQRPGHRL